MKFLQILKNIFLDYKKIFYIVSVKKSNYIIVIFLTFITVGLDALGIGMLLPIGEYLLNENKDSIPDTYSWKLLTNIFNYISIQPNIYIITLSVVVIIIFRQIVTFVRAILTDIIRLQSIQSLRENLFLKFLRQDVYFMKQQNTGAHNNIINLETDKLGFAIINPLNNFSGLIMMLSYLILMMIVSVKATFIVCFCIIIIGSLLKKFLYYIKSLSSNIIEINNKFSQNMVDRLMASKLIRLTNMIKSEVKLNKDILEDQYLNNLKLAKIQKLIDTSIEPLLLMIAVPVIFLAVKFDFALAELGIFIILIARFIPVFKITLSGIQSQVSFHASITKMLDLIDEVEKQKEIRYGSYEAPVNIKSIEFKNIYFDYAESNDSILENFSCKLEGQRINALVGPSGKGKTTLVNMITRLIEPKSGTININDLPIKNININKIRSICSFIEQKPSFIRGTIIEHIAYGNAKVDIKDARDAARLANADNFIMKLKDNYYHKLGESGIGLSGGQLQRLELTRAIASEKPIMILDEPTSALDQKNTDDIFITLKNINEKNYTTIIIVTHDSVALKYCDNIIKV